MPEIEMIIGAIATEEMIKPVSETGLLPDSSWIMIAAPTIRTMQNKQIKSQPKNPVPRCLKRTYCEGMKAAMKKASCAIAILPVVSNMVDVKRRRRER